MSRSFTYRVLAYRTRHWAAIERCRSKEAWKNVHGSPRGRQPGRCELHLCQYIHSYIQDEEWPRQTSGHGFWWFILRGMLLLDLEHCCREQSSGSPEARLVWFLRYVEYHEYWNETNEECRNPEETSAERFADRPAVIAGVLLRVGLFCELWTRTSSSQFVPPIPVMLRLRYIMLLTLLTTICAFAVYLFFWPAHGACQAQVAEKSGKATIQQVRLSEAGLCDLTPRTASPERIGESSRSSGSDCAAPGRDGTADRQMCVTVP